MNEELRMKRADDEHHDSILASGYTGCDVVVFSQHEVRKYQPGPDEVCISIGSQRWGIYAPLLRGKFKELLELEFDDVTNALDAMDANSRNISDEDALKVVKFFEKHLKESKKIIIHCFAGIARSRSMAAALCMCFDVPFRYTIWNTPVKLQILKAYRQMRKEELKCLATLATPTETCDN